MSKIILTLTVFAMIISTLIIVVDSRVNISYSEGIENTQKISSVSINIIPDLPNSDVDDVCDKACGGCCFHYVTSDHAKFNSLYFIPHKNIDLYNINLSRADFDYGLKRPPKSIA